MALDEGMDAKAGDGLPISVEKDVLLRPAQRGDSIQLFYCGSPQRAGALLVAFADEPGRLGMPVDIGDSELGSLAGTAPRVVEK